MRDYKKLIVFQKAHRFVIAIYKITKAFPKHEQYALTSQLRRAAISVPANIVEGSRRNSEKEYLQFLNISLSSLSEVEYYIELSNELKYIDSKEYAGLISSCNDIFAMLHGLMKTIKDSSKQ
ncbi:MAG: four helix bundle protein [Endomicrobiales bacterium]|nr:four helix bundle protein [Endomicrobiales bacterium]